MTASEKFGTALERLEAAFSRAMPKEARRFRPPLTRSGLKELAQRLVPYRLPDDLAQIYCWHNGFEDWREDSGHIPLLLDATFPPLEDAIANYEWHLQYASDEQDPSRWPASWFLAFGDGNSGDLVTLEPRSSPLSEIVWGWHSGDGELSPTYDSITSMIETTATLWENDLLPWALDDDDMVRHRRRLAMVARLNPECFDDQLDWTHRRYRPSVFLDDDWLEEWRQAVGYEPLDGPLPEPRPIAALNTDVLSEPVPIMGTMRGLAGGLDWRNVEVTDGTGTVRVQLSRQTTKNYMTTELGDRHMLWVRALPEADGERRDRDVGSAMGARVFDRIAAELLAVEIRPIYDDDSSTA